MVNVAVAGGTSPTMGRSIVQAIKATGKHDVVIFSRAKSPGEKPSGQTKHGVPLIPITYDDRASVAGALTQNKIHTLISCIKVNDPQQMITFHETLLEAAKDAGVSRFIMGDWAMGPLSSDSVEVLAHKATLDEMGQKHMREARAAGQHVVECSSIQNGMLMEYFVQGHPGGDVQGLQAGLKDDFMMEYIDIANRKIVVPCQEDGTPSRVSTTSIWDIGNYMAAAMDLGPGKLVGRVGMSGQVLPNLQYVADFLKKNCGRELDVSTMTPSSCEKRAEDDGKTFQEAMAKGEFDLKAFMGRMVAQMMKVSCEGKMNGGVVEDKLNQMCPQVKPIQVEELLVKAWGAGK